MRFISIGCEGIRVDDENVFRVAESLALTFKSAKAFRVISHWPGSRGSKQRMRNEAMQCIARCRRVKAAIRAYADAVERQLALDDCEDVPF